MQNIVLLFFIFFYFYFYLKAIRSKDIVTKLVLFTTAIGGINFPELVVNIVYLYKLPLRVAKINIFDGKLKLKITETYMQDGYLLEVWGRVAHGQGVQGFP